MTIEAYINPEFRLPQMLLFLFMSMAGVVLCLLIVLFSVKVSVSSVPKSDRRKAFYHRAFNRVQRFYEMIIAGTSVMSFSCAYVVINHIETLASSGTPLPDDPRIRTLMELWGNGRDFMLLVLICLSCVLNTLLDHLIIPLRRLVREEIATIRMLAMFYVILLLVVLNIIGDESEYSPVMVYYLGLMIGRFVYFDASFLDFLHNLKNVLCNLHLLLMGLALTGALSFLGFQMGFLLERNYYIMGIFYTSLFLLVCIFLIHISHILHLFIRRPAEADEEDEEED